MFPLKDNIPNRRFPLVTVALIAINVVVYLLSLRHGGSLFGGPSEQVITRYGAIPYELTHPGHHCDLVSTVGGQAIACQGQAGVSGTPSSQPATWETVFTSMFLHASFLHIAGNMLFLAIFGPNVEDAMGRVKYLAFYLLGGLAALATQTAVDPSSTGPTLGASGAIAAVLAAYIVLYPRARILTLVFVFFFFTFIELPALVVLGVWFAEQVAFAAAGLTNPVGNSGGVAYFAHVGGFVLGLILVRAFARRRRTVVPRYPSY